MINKSEALNPLDSNSDISGSLNSPEPRRWPIVPGPKVPQLPIPDRSLPPKLMTELIQRWEGEAVLFVSTPGTPDLQLQEFYDFNMRAALQLFVGENISSRQLNRIVRSLVQLDDTPDCQMLARSLDELPDKLRQLALDKLPENLLLKLNPEELAEVFEPHTAAAFIRDVSNILIRRINSAEKAGDDDPDQDNYGVGRAVDKFEKLLEAIVERDMTDDGFIIEVAERLPTRNDGDRIPGYVIAALEILVENDEDSCAVRILAAIRGFNIGVDQVIFIKDKYDKE
ncbi:hypothetical protein A2154_02725 [Candidatus Gottesmanbacteria bacterium RBG_16_43_7]|uniref:Uncharacterized protein n=1 Tax=Candidatus Gottesmanbacteria bacterium RBG_16_43_7 TaxID=1798373 RepID=A0A1F5Z997_9BACT|nr:MAG: hypothetical protein A2154_02725 [Candidatus Gottesmanbacteria bacterium RBG_16_43_7]